MIAAEQTGASATACISPEVWTRRTTLQHSREESHARRDGRTSRSRQERSHDRVERCDEQIREHEANLLLPKMSPDYTARSLTGARNVGC